MHLINLQLPPGAVLKGQLLSSQIPSELVSDMVEIDLPDGTTIDVGWVPEHDPKGAYRVVVFRGYWNRQVMPILYFKSLEAVVAQIEGIAQIRR